MAGERFEVGQLCPQLGRALDEGPLDAWLVHRVGLSPSPRPTLRLVRALRRLQHAPAAPPPG
jgi:hypothetical protein